jgi:hypothetical protein
MSKPIVSKPLSQALGQPGIPVTICDFPIVQLPHEQHIHANLHLPMNVEASYNISLTKKIVTLLLLEWSLESFYGPMLVRSR